MFRRVVLSFCVVAMLASAAGFAATTGRLTGTVKDNTGLALPGVTVQISSDKLIGGPQVAITGAEGEFSFNLLSVGLYTVSASLPGFQAASGQVRVNLDTVASVDFSLLPDQFVGEVVVEATVPVVDTQQVNSQQVFDQDYLQNAAVGASGRDYLSVLSQAAGVAGSGNASVYGSSTSDNSYLIDGMNTTDPVTGTFGTNFNYDAIQEVSFQTGGFEAEFGQATGGIINLVTKSGGNDFSGSLDIRYRDQDFTENGTHFDRKEQISSFEDYSVTLGGPIFRDKLWFFVSGEDVDTKYQPEGAHFDRNYLGQNYIGKLTWQMIENHRAVFKVSGDPATIPGANVSRFVMPAASYEQEQGGTNWSIELNSVLSDSLLLNARVAINRGYINGGGENNPDTISGHYNQDTFISDGNYSSTFRNDRDRDEYGLSLTYFLDGFAGSHEFKVGLEYNKLMFNDISYYNGGGFFYDRGGEGVDFNDLNGDGFSNGYVVVKEPEAQAKDPVYSEGNITTFYLQDSWRPVSNLTLKPGVRFENVKMDNSTGEQIADMDKWQPRLGFAWDIKGDAKFVFRGSWGRFMDPTALSIPGFASGVDQIYHDYNTLELYCNTLGLCDPSHLPPSWDWHAWTNWDGIDYTLIDNRDTTVYGPAQTPDQAGVGHLKAPYAESLILAFETQVAPETSFELTYIDKDTNDIIEDTCSNNTWIWTDDPMPSLDDPSTWTTAAGCEYFMIANNPFFYRNYKAVVGKFETRGDWWHLLVSLTNSSSRGNSANGALQSYATGLGDFYPVNFINQDGYLPDHRKNRLKVSGYALLPWDITVGIDGYWSDKGHITPYASCTNYLAATQPVLDFYGITDEMQQYCYSGDGIALGGYDIFLKKRGSFETKPVWNVDLQISKAFQIKQFDVSVVLAIYNVVGRELDQYFNGEYFWKNDEFGEPVEVGTDAGGNPVYENYVPIGKAYSYGLPRRYELGFRVEF